MSKMKIPELTVKHRRIIKLVEEREKPWTDRSVKVKYPIVEYRRVTLPEKRKKKSAKETISEFINGTTIHGLKYLSDVPIRISELEKPAWFLILVLGVVCIGLMLEQFLDRYDDNPTITILHSSYISPHTVPFPAITICPIMPPPKSLQAKILESLRLPLNMSKSEAQFLIMYAKDMSHPFTKHPDSLDMDRLQLLIDYNDIPIVEFLKLTVLPCDALFKMCWVSSLRVDCNRIFKQSFTRLGICCSFNYILEENVRNRKVEKWHSSSYGVHDGVSILFNHSAFGMDYNDEKIDTIISNVISCMIIIHPLHNYPTDEFTTYLLQTNNELQIGVKAQSIMKSDMPCDDKDKKLEFFPFAPYQYSNCYVNCRIKAYLEYCNCIIYYYAAMVDTTVYSICDYEEHECLHDYGKEIHLVVVNDSSVNFTCSCTEACAFTSYITDVNTMRLEPQSFTVDPIYRNFENNNAILRVFWSSQNNKLLLTIPSITGTFLLASIGGIFSLFLGCSFIGFVEIFYYFVLSCYRFFKS